MSTRLGLAIGVGEVRAALLRNGRIVWTASRAVTGSASLADVIADAINAAPLPRFPRSWVVAALGPASTQVKRLPGVAASAKRQVVTQLVRSNVTRFFLRNGIPLSVASAHRDHDGWWIAVMESPSVAAVEDACERSRIRLAGCVPTITALATMANDGDIECVDGLVRARFTLRKGRWTDMRREHQSDAPPAECVNLGVPFGVEARYADAVGAALSSPRSPLFLRAAPRRATERQRFWLRAVLAVCAVLAMLAALAAPGVAASRSLARDSAKLEHLRGTLTAWAPALHQLRQTTAALNEIGRFGRERRSAALLLGAISTALPDSTAIVNVRMDSAGGAMTLLSLRAASVVPRLAAIPAISDPRIVGAVTRETVSGRQLQRIAVRFQFRRSPSTSEGPRR